MACLACTSGNQAEFTAEINIHLYGRKNIDNPGVLVFPKVLVCLDCGSSRFSISETELSQLAKQPVTHASTVNGSADGAVRSRGISFGS